MGLPLTNLDDKSFDELVKEARALITRYAPEWTDHNLHDPGITFVELFAWLAEMHNYQLNRVTDANYRKFLGLHGLQPYSVRPARVGVTLTGVMAAMILKKGARLIARSGEEQIVFETEEDFTLVPVTLRSIICRADGKNSENIRANGKDDICFAAFGEPAAVGATLELGFDGALPEAELQLLFDLYEEDLSIMEENGTAFPSARLAWEYLKGGGWEPLTIRRDSSLALTRSGSLVFTWPPDVDQAGGSYWIRARLAGGLYEIPPLVNTVLLNTVSAVQVESLGDESAGTGFPGQMFELKRNFVMPGSLKVELQGDNGDWEEVADFDSSGPNDRHYIFDPTSKMVVFGNGLNGMIPGREQTIRVLYRITRGEKGNMSSGQLFTVVGNEELTGTNPNPAAGGAAAELLEEAQKRAKKDFRTTCRAITAADYEELALDTPGVRVARATAIPGFHPEYPCMAMPGAVTVVVVPEVRRGTRSPIPGAGFLRTVFAHLDPRRLVTVDLHLVGPEYVTVAVSCKVYPKKNSSPAEVKMRVRERLELFLDPFSGGPEGHGWPFGRPVYPSDIYQLLDSIEGVDYATDVAITAEGYADNGGIIHILRTALVVSGEHHVEIL